jgi:hypothetical protein
MYGGDGDARTAIYTTRRPAERRPDHGRDKRGGAGDRTRFRSARVLLWWLSTSPSSPRCGLWGLLGPVKWNFANTRHGFGSKQEQKEAAVQMYRTEK